MRISDWSSDVCSSDLPRRSRSPRAPACCRGPSSPPACRRRRGTRRDTEREALAPSPAFRRGGSLSTPRPRGGDGPQAADAGDPGGGGRSEEHTSELQSLMRISYAVFCLKKKKRKVKQHHN